MDSRASSDPSNPSEKKPSSSPRPQIKSSPATTAPSPSKAVAALVSTPEKAVQSRWRLRNRSVAFSVKEVKQAALGLQRADRGSADRSDFGQSQHDLLSVEEQLGTGSSSVPKPSKAKTHVKLPEKYEMLCEFFNCMESSIRLLRLKGTMLTFANISTSIQHLSERRFTHGHLAQLKHILPEAISVRKVNLHDETTLCVKPELQVTLHVEELAAHMKLKGEGGSLILRKIFRERLVDFFKEHPQGEDIPEEELPHPFNQRKPMIPPNVARVSTFPTCVESSSMMPSNDQYVVPSHVSRSFKRRFSKKTSIPDAEKTPIACLSEASLKDGPSVSVAPSPMKHTLKPPTPYKSLPDCPTSLASSSIPGTNEEETKVPKKAGNYFPEDMNALEGTPVKFVSTPARLMTATPEIQMPKRSRPTMDYDSPPPKKTTKRSARTKLFTTPKKNTKAEVEESEGRNLSLDNYDDDDVLTFLPKTLLQSVREKEKKALKEKESGCADSVRRQKLIAFLPRVFDTILLMFQSRKRSAMTKQEVTHKIIASHHKIVDRGEVERQLELLQELVPDWISEKKTFTGDILYRVNELSSPEEIRQRLAEAE